MRTYQLTKTILVLLTAYLMHGAVAQNVDVNPAYGTPSVSVPLFTIQDRDFSYPVYLYYSTSGVRPAEPSGMFGTTWDWNLRTSVTRVLRGLPDEIDNSNYKGWLSNNSDFSTGLADLDADEDYSIYDDEEDAFSFLDGFYDASTLVTKDAEPDLFSVSAPGLSVSFLYDTNDNIVTTTPFSGTITPTISGGKITSFVIKTSGRTYTFDLLEETSLMSNTFQNFSDHAFNPFHQDFLNLTHDFIDYVSSWHLTSIETMGGADISFEYVEEVEESDEVGVKFSTFIPENNLTYADVYYNAAWYTIPFYQQLDQVYNKRVLNVIRTSNNGEIRIIKGQDPIGTQIGVSKQIIKPIEQETAFINSIGFYDQRGEYAGAVLFDIHQQSYFHSNATASRGFLKKVWFDGEKENDPITFSYYGLNAGNNILSGDTTTFDQYGYASSQAYYVDGKLNGSYDTDLLHVGMLKTVTYREGGYTELMYEPNFYRDEVAQTDVYGGGLRVMKKITKADNNTQQLLEYEYKDASGNSSGVLLHRPRYFFEPDFYFDPANDEILGIRQLAFHEDELDNRKIFFQYDLDMENAVPSNVGYERIKIKTKNNGHVIEEYAFSKAWNTYSMEFLEEDWEAPKVKVARENLSSVTYDPVAGSVGYGKYPFAPCPTLPGMNGRMLKTTTYDDAGIPKSETEYFYRLNTAIGYVTGLRIEQLPTKYDFDQDANMFVYALYQIPVNATILQESVHSSVYEGSEEMETYAEQDYFNESYPMVRESRSVDSKGDTRVVRTKYLEELNFSGVSSGEAQELKELYESPHGFGKMPIETLSILNRGGQEYVMSASTATYMYESSPEWFYMDESYVATFAEPLPIGQFNPLTISAGSLQRDGNYRKVLETKVVDATNRRTLTIESNELVVQTSVYSNGHLAGRVSNASAGNFGFMGFEEDDPADANAPYNFSLYDVSSWSGNYYAAGRLDENSLTMSKSLSQELRRTGIGKSCDQYVVSFWAKTATNGTVRVSSGSVITDIAVTSGDWKYYEALIDVGALGSTFDVILAPNSSGLVINIDELWYYPADAGVGYMVTGLGGRVLAEMSGKGKGIYHEYDVINRPVLIKDDDGNILRRMEYGKDAGAPFDLTIFPKINGSTVTLKASPYKSSASYYWDSITSLDEDILTPNGHSFSGISATGNTYTAPAVKSTIFLKVVYDGNTYYKSILFDPQNHLN